MGLGRIVYPSRASAHSTERSPGYRKIVENILTDPTLNHVYFDISWDEVAKYVIETPETVQSTADILNRYPDRFLFGTDNVAPANQEAHFKVYEMYAPLWAKLTPEASEKVRKGNYARLFDEARTKVRAWESENVKQ